MHVSVYIYIYTYIQVYIYIYGFYSVIVVGTVPSTTHVPSDTFRTWNMVPHPRGEMLSSMISSNKPRSRKWEKTQKPKIRPVFYHVFSLYYQKSNIILWSIRTFWYKGSAENKKKQHVHGKRHISQKSQPKTKSTILGKLRCDVKRLILVRYGYILNI